MKPELRDNTYTEAELYNSWYKEFMPHKAAFIKKRKREMRKKNRRYEKQVIQEQVDTD